MIRGKLSQRIFLLGFLLITSQAGFCQSIKVAAASNLLLPLQEIEKKFEKKFPYQVEIIPGASGSLTTQIINGAPYHIFVSADDKYIQELVDQEKAHGGPSTLCLGTIYLWVKDKVKGNSPESILNSSQVKSVGLAHPDLAPYGKLSRDWIEIKKLGLQVQEKIVYGNSIGQVNQFILAKSVDAAFTTNSLKFSGQKTEGRFFLIDEIWLEPVPQSMILLKTDGASMFVATLFKDFLLGMEAQKVFKKFGFETPVGR